MLGDEQRRRLARRRCRRSGVQSRLRGALNRRGISLLCAA
jgi:hypothetical protein